MGCVIYSKGEFKRNFSGHKFGPTLPQGHNSKIYKLVCALMNAPSKTTALIHNPSLRVYIFSAKNFQVPKNYHMYKNIVKKT